MVRRVVLAVLLVASVLGLAATPVHAADFDFAQCGPNGLSAHATYDPGVTATTATQTFSLSVSMTCSGPGDEAGPWTLSFSGTGDESCVSGRGSGSVTGVNGTSGESWSLPFTYHRHTLLMTLYAGPDGPEGQAASLSLIDANLNFGCPTTAESFYGLGAVADTTPPSNVPTALHATGNGVVAPGYTFPPTGHPVSWQFLATATGVVNGVPAQCSLGAGGAGIAFGVALENGTGEARCTGSGVAISCSLSYSRTGSVLQVAGTCSGTAAGTLQGQFALTFTSFNPTTTYNVQGGVTIT